MSLQEHVDRFAIRAFEAEALDYLVKPVSESRFAATIKRLTKRLRTRADAPRELYEQRDLQASAAVAVERGRIARELHDVIAHNISMIVVQAFVNMSVVLGMPDKGV